MDNLFTSISQRLIIALDFTPDRNESPVYQAQHFLERMLDEFVDLDVTLKINTVARILGANAVELIEDNGFSCFLDLKLFDIKDTLVNDAEWISYFSPLMLTICERTKPDALATLNEILPDTLILPVEPLTDLSNKDFMHFGHLSRVAAVQAFFERIKKTGFAGSICAPTDISLAPPDFVDRATIITPAVKPAWTVPDNNSGNALTPAKAIAAGADALVVGRGITAQANMREAALKTIDEIEAALAERHSS